jgi:hypothetical protein
MKRKLAFLFLIKNKVYQITPTDVQLIQFSNGTKYYKCTVTFSGISSRTWVEIVSYNAKQNDKTTKFHPYFDSINNIWTDTLTISYNKIEWISIEDLSGTYIVIFYLGNQIG